MPRQKKVSFNQKLASYNVLIEDTSVNSEYFKVSQFPEGFTGGKNGFLLAGTPFLVPNSRILVEVVNVNNETIYYESVKDYTEGNSKLISFEIYENTPPGLYKVILLGQVRLFSNGAQIPEVWDEKYNVRWTRDVIVEPRRRNTSPIRFKSSPRIFVDQEKIIYTPSSSYVTEFDSLANISISPRYKSTLTDGYTITLISGSKFTNNYFGGVVTGSITASVDGNTYSTQVNLPLHTIINETHAETTSSLMRLDGIVDTFFLKSGSYEYTSPQNGKSYQVTSSIGLSYSYINLNENITLDTGSYSQLRLVNLATNTGEVYKTEISYKVEGTSAEHVLISTPNVSVPQLLVTSSNIGDQYWIGTFISGGLNGIHANENNWYARSMPVSNTTEGYELLANQVPFQYYTASSAFNLVLDSSNIMNGVYPDVPVTGNSVSPYVFGTKEAYTLFGSSEYTLKFTALFSAYSSSTLLSNYENSELYVYLAPTNENRILDNNPLGQLITKLTINPNTEKQYFDNVVVNFTPQVFDFSQVSLRFIATNGMWQFSNISIKPAEEFAFNPDETIILVPNYIDEKTINYKARFFDINGNSTKLEIESAPIAFTGPRKYVKRSGDAMYGELYINEVPIQQQTLESAFTGLLSGGVITVNFPDSASYDISAGSGYIVDNYSNPLAPTYQLVSWSRFENITPAGLGVSARTNIAISSSGQIHEQSTAFTDRDYREYIVLGRVAHVGTPYIQRALSLPLTVYNRHYHWFDLASAITPLNIAGNDYTFSGSSMQISKTSGETYRIGSNYRNEPGFPDITADTAISTVSFAYRWRSGSGFAEAPVTTMVTGSFYDDGSGILQSVANNRYTVQRIYFFGATNTTRIQFGQHLYNSMADAIIASNSEIFVADPNLSSDATLREFMILKGNAVNLSDPLEATFISVSQFGAGGGAGGGGVSSLTTLTDVELNGVTNKDVLTYSSASGAWINHQVFPYSGSIIITGSVTASAFTGSLSYQYLTSVPTLVSASSQVDHNLTTNYVANQHIDHSTVSISPGSGLTGGGTIAATRTLTLDTSSAHFTGGVTTRVNALGVFSSSGQVSHNSTTGYVANEHINHTTVSISAGSGLTGGGDISTTRTLTLDTSSAHFTGGVKSKMNADGVYSSSAQLVVSAYTNATDNRVLTSTGAGGINAEANLTFDGNIFAVNTNHLYVSASNVGIGTTSPSKLLHIADTAIVDREGIITSREGHNIGFGVDRTGANWGMGFYVDGTKKAVLDSNGGWGIGTGASYMSGNPPANGVIIEGTVGIGTEAPQYKLHVSGGLSLFNSSNAGSDGNSGIRIVSPIATTHYNWMIAAQQNVGAAFEITPSTAVGGATFSTPTAVFTATGRVGIGIVSPATKLEVSDSNAIIRASGTAGTVPQLQLSSAGVVNWSLRSNAGAASDFTIYQDSTERVRIDSSGNLGIGVSPSYRLDALAPAGAGNVFRAGQLGVSNGYAITTSGTALTHKWANAGSDVMTLDTAGNLGLGVIPSAANTATIQLPGTTTLSGAGSAASFAHNAYNNSGWKYIGTGPATLYQKYNGIHNWYVAPSGTAGNAISFTGSMALDASGNLGLSVTPSVWGVGKAIEINGFGNALWSPQAADIRLLANARYDGGSYRYTYSGNPAAGYFVNGSAAGGHIWYIAPAGTAGNVITFTEAWRISSTGHFLAGADATYDIGGGLSTSRPRNLYLSGTGYLGTGLNIYNAGSATLYSSDNLNSYSLTNAGASGAGNAALVFKNGASETMRLNASGNLGINVTPSAWNANARALQISTATALFQNANGGANFGQNVYESGNNVYTYPLSFFATRYEQQSGQHRWFTAPSGTAGNVITFTQSMALDASGNLAVDTNTLYVDATNNRVGVNTASPAYAVDVVGSVRCYGDVLSSATGVATFGTLTNQNLRLATNNTHRVEIDTSGNFGIGMLPNAKLSVNGNTNVTGSLNVNGDLTAVTKSFLINHPIKLNHKLRYGSLESPYHGVRLTGEGELINGVSVINLPDYICELVNTTDISIQLTAYKHKKNIWVEDIDVTNNKFTVKTNTWWFDKKPYKFFWSFTATRKDIPDMEVEFPVNDDK